MILLYDYSIKHYNHLYYDKNYKYNNNEDNLNNTFNNISNSVVEKKTEFNKNNCSYIKIQKYKFK